MAETDGLPMSIDPTSKHAPKTKTTTVIGEHVAAAIRLLLFTGCRVSEILNLQWKHVDLERGMLFLPDSKTGKKAVVLNSSALKILENLSRLGVYVIAGETAGTINEKPRADLKKPWRSIRRQGRLTDVRLHDLRHNYASFGVSVGLGLPIIGKLLGHQSTATTRGDAHLDVDPLRRATDTIGSDIATALGEKKKST